MKNDEIKKAFECLTPDDAAKERMLKGIMAQSAAMKQEASAEPEVMPWYIRLRAPLGFCAAAMACVMVFTFAASNPALFQSSSSRQQLLETKPAVTTAVPAAETTAASEISEDETEYLSEVQKTTKAAEETAQLTTTTTAVKAVQAEVTISSAVSEAVAPVTTKLPVSSITTAATEAELTTTETEAVTTAATEVPEIITTTTVSILSSLYGDLFDFNLVTWAGRSYATDYAVADYGDLADHLGSGVAKGENAEGTYTILLYKLKDVPVEKGFAVQYAGQTAYYIFYSVE